MNELLVFDRFGRKVFLDHKGNLKRYRVLELTQIKTCQLADFFKPVYQRVAVYKQLARRFRNIEVVFKKHWMVCRVSLSSDSGDPRLKTSCKKHLAKGGRQLINKPADTKIFIADDVLFSIEHLADLKSNLCLFV